MEEVFRLLNAADCFLIDVESENAFQSVTLNYFSSLTFLENFQRALQYPRGRGEFLKLATFIQSSTLMWSYKNLFDSL